MKELTIFTPTYNRAYILPKLYESLCKEPTDDFIWLIVDDGSSDNTHDIVDKWQKEGRIEIVYHKQQNGGKMRAHNKGVELCSTPLFFCIDSDDQIAEGAVEKIKKISYLLKEDNSLSGIVAKRFIVNRLSSNNLPNLQRSTLHDIYKIGFKGDTSLVFKTSVLREYAFPEIEGEKFVTEAYVYNQIDQKYELLIMNEYLMRCEYQEDGYTVNANSLYLKYPKGWAMYYAQYYNYYANTMRDKIKYMAYYISMCKLAKMSFMDILKKSPSFMICLASFPVGIRFFYKLNSNICNK